MGKQGGKSTTFLRERKVRRKAEGDTEMDDGCGIIA